MEARLDVDLLDPDDPFEIDDRNRPHLFKHGPFGVEDIYDVWASDPVFVECDPPADWLMIGRVPGTTLVVPIAKPTYPDPSTCRPIGVYVALPEEEALYLRG